MKSSDRYTIGQLAARFGLAPHVLRHWEDAGVLAPLERVNGRRYYDESHAARITMILRGKEIGLTLEQIRELHDTPHDEHVPLLLRHRAELDAQIERIQAAKAMIDHAIACHHPDFTQCEEFQDVARAAAPRTASAPARTP